jgi:DNA repair protein RadC
MTSKDSPLDQFGKELVEEIRDKSIEDLFEVISGKINAPILLELHKKIYSDDISQTESFKLLTIKCVDTVLHNFLWMLEQHEELDLIVNKKNRVISLKSISDGLPGELPTDDGWIGRFSKYPPSIE